MIAVALYFLMKIHDLLLKLVLTGDFPREFPGLNFYVPQ